MGTGAEPRHQRSRFYADHAHMCAYQVMMLGKMCEAHVEWMIDQALELLWFAQGDRETIFNIAASAAALVE